MSASLKKGITAIHTATLAWLNRAAKTVLLTDMQNFGFSAMDYILLVKENWSILDYKQSLFKTWACLVLTKCSPILWQIHYVDNPTLK